MAPLLLIAIVIGGILVNEAQAQEQPLLQFEHVLTRSDGGLSTDRIVDVGTGPAGEIYVLRADGVIERWREKVLVSTWAGLGRGAGMFQQPTELAVSPRGSVHVFDVATQAVTSFDSTGLLRHRRALPIGLAPARDFVIDQDGYHWFSGYSPGAPANQVHVFCPAIRCSSRSSVPARSTKEPSFAGFVQGGYLTSHGASVVMASVNPNRIVRVDRQDLTSTVLFRDDLLPRSEPEVAVDSAGEANVILRFPTSTGIVKSRGYTLVSYFFPDEAESELRVFTQDWNLVGALRTAGRLTLKARLGSAKIVMLREVGDQEVVIYHSRLTQDQHE